MAARGAILRELPRDNRTVLKVPRTDILESPMATTSALKADVKRRLDDIAVDSRAHIAVLNIASAGYSGSGGSVLATANGQNGEAAHLLASDSTGNSGSGETGEWPRKFDVKSREDKGGSA